MSEVDLKEMLEAGVHFGHKKDKWNPKMRSFIFTDRNGIYIFDLVKTKDKLETAQKFAAGLAGEGKTILFVGTKKQVQGVVKGVAEKAGTPYLVERWPGGMLTNFSTILVRLKYLKEAEEKEAAGRSVTKKEALNLKRELAKLNEIFEGVKDMRKVPDALFVADVLKERIAVREAKKLGIPVIGIVDTNADPDIEYPIPANDDAVRSVQYISEKIAEAIRENKKATASESDEEDKVKEVKQKTVPEKPEEESAKKKTKKEKTDEGAGEEAHSVDAQDETIKLEPEIVDESEKKLEKLEMPADAIAMSGKKAEVIDETEKKLEKLEMKAEEEIIVKKSKPKEE